MSETGGDSVWRGMTRAQLDAAYNNGAAVADSAARIAEWTERSARLRERHPDALDLRYGARERNRIDIFRNGAADASLLVFFHGGYWQRNAKEIFSFLAGGPIAAGFAAGAAGPPLAPDARLSEIVAETQAAIRWLRHEGGRHGV